MLKAARFQGPVQRQSAPYPESHNPKESAMRKLLLLVLCALYFAASPVLAAGKQKLINGIDANFPPFAFIDKSGQPSGFDVETMN